MRPVASTCKVGTRFKGFVVKTRKANHHSNRRVKYWAKVSTSKPKPKKASQTPKSTRKTPTKRRKLRGGGEQELEEVLREVVAGGGEFAKSTNCDIETATQLRKIGERAYDLLGNYNVRENKPQILRQIENDYKSEVTNYSKRSVKNKYKSPRLNALAIVMANISNAANSITKQLHSIVVSNFSQTYSRWVKYDPNGDMYDQIQAQYPVFIRSLVFYGIEVKRGTKFNDESIANFIKDGGHIVAV